MKNKTKKILGKTFTTCFFDVFICTFEVVKKMTPIFIFMLWLEIFEVKSKIMIGIVFVALLGALLKILGVKDSHISCRR